MTKPTRFIALLAFSALAGITMAEEKTELNVVANGHDGTELAKTAVTLDSKLKFGETGVEVYSGETLVSVYPYADTANISFSYGDGTGVAEISQAGALRLRNNPVGETLELIGFDADSAPLSVVDLKGVVKISLSEWRGGAVDVSDLTPGLYFVTVNKSTLKFIKK